MEEKINAIASKIQAMDTRAVDALVSDAAKCSKKKRLSSGSLTFRDYCKKIAEFIVSKRTTQGLIEKYNLA